MRRFLQHVLPRGFHKVRYFGLWHPVQRNNAARVRQMLQLSMITAIDGAFVSLSDGLPGSASRLL
jgi:hypothetical protein